LPAPVIFCVIWTTGGSLPNSGPPPRQEKKQMDTIVTPGLVIDTAAEELFAVGAGCAGDLFQHRATLSDDHSLVALPLAVNVHVDVHKVCTGALF